MTRRAVFVLGTCHLVLGTLCPRAADSPKPAKPPQPLYETRQVHDPNGIGKFYMGREIAMVMGHLAADWLDRPEREQEEAPTKLLTALALEPGAVVADI